LIVDGDPDSRLLYRIVLAKIASTIVEAADGTEALGKAMQERPDVVVTDTRLSGIDGYKLCSMLRLDQSTKSTAIVIVTALAYPDDLDRAINAGADEVLVKPCLPDDVMAAAYRSWRRRYGDQGVPTSQSGIIQHG
jgi:CheY-like chemotaxis protein